MGKSNYGYHKLLGNENSFSSEEEEEYYSSDSSYSYSEGEFKGETKGKIIIKQADLSQIKSSNSDIKKDNNDEQKPIIKKKNDKKKKKVTSDSNSDSTSDEKNNSAKEPLSSNECEEEDKAEIIYNIQIGCEPVKKISLKIISHTL